MKQNYDLSLTEVLKSEGGYSNDVGDPGGPTKYGITIGDVKRFLNPKATAQDVKNLTLDQAKAIYRKAYWDALNCDDLPSGVDYCVFDYGVNSGISRSRKVLDRFKSLTPIQTINSICDERMSFLRALQTWSRFGKGWSDRVSKVRRISVQLAHQEAISAHTTAIGTVATGTAVGTGGLIMAIQHFHNWPLAAIIAGTALVVLAGIVIIHHSLMKGK